MNGKVLVILILCLVIIGFFVAPVMATESAVLPNGDFISISDDGNIYRYYHNDTGTWETNYKDITSSNGLSIYSIPRSTSGKTNLYSNSIIPQIKPVNGKGYNLPSQVSRFSTYIP